MWVLFLILITAPGAYEVHPLNTYPGVEAEKNCKTKLNEIADNLKATYKSPVEKDTYGLICLKQLEIIT